MKNICCILLFLVLLLSSSFGESPYSLDLTTDILAAGGSLGIFTLSRVIQPRVSGQGTLDEINALDAAAMYPYAEGLDTLGTVGAYTALLIPAISVLYEIDFPDRFITYSVMYAEAFLLTFGSKDLIKALVSRYRPFSYLGTVPAGELDDVSNSFPSGHTAFGFLGATFLSSTFCTEYPDSPWKLPVILGSYTLAGSVAVSRVLSGNHFITDVLAGAALGSLWGWIVPRIHVHNRESDIDIAPVPTSGGIAFSIRI